MRRRGHILISSVIASVCLCSASASADTIRVLDGNTDAYNARIVLIDRARCSIDLAYFLLDDSPIACSILCRLCQAAGRGVRVRLLLDSCHIHVPRPRLRRLIRAGIAIREYHPPRWCRLCRSTRRLHDKLLLVDGQAMILGGRNVGEKYFGLSPSGNFRDRDVLIAGPSAGHARSYFRGMWNSGHVAEIPPTAAADFWRQLREPPNLIRIGGMARSRWQRFCRGAAADSGCVSPKPQSAVVPGRGLLQRNFQVPTCAVRFVHSSRVVAGYTDITDDLLALVGCARRRIVIETPYLLLTDRFQRALQQALCRGVEVTISTNSLATTNKTPAHAGYRCQRRTLLRMGINLWEYQGRETLHNKCWVVDETVMIGSYNLDPRSDLCDTQSAAIIRDGQLAAAVLTVMRNDRCCNSAQISRDGKPLETKRPLCRPSTFRRVWTQSLRLFVPLMRRQL